MKKIITKITLIIFIMLAFYFSYVKLKPVVKSIPTQPMPSIIEEANTLMNFYNKIYKDSAKVEMPKTNGSFPKCAVPLDAQWPDKPEIDPSPYWNIKVECFQTVAGAKIRNWQVVIPTDRRKALVDTVVLQKVNSTAAEFIDVYNRQNNTHWSAVQPDGRVIVPYCAVPFKARWQKNTSRISTYWNIEVICDRTVPDKVMNKWTLLIPTTRPKNREYE